MSDEPSTQAADLIALMLTQLVTRVMEAPNGFSKIAEGRDKTADGTMELPYLELSLKSLISAGDGGTATHDDHNVLRRSDLSAFSRYHTSATSNQATTGYGRSCSSLDNSSEAVKTESTYNMISNSNAVPLKQGSNGGSDNNGMGWIPPRMSSLNQLHTRRKQHPHQQSSVSKPRPSTILCSFDPLVLGKLYKKKLMV